MPRRKYKVTWNEQNIRYTRTFTYRLTSILEVPAKVKEKLEKGRHKDTVILQVEELA